MKTKLLKIISILYKNFIVFVIGGLLGIIITIIFIKPLLSSTIKTDVGVSIIALIPTLITIYSIIFGFAGGILAIIIYNLIKIFRKK